MNGQETEAKFYVRDLAKVAGWLRGTSAILIHARVHETNLRFDTPSRELSRQGRVLRLRRDDQARLAYKGPGELDYGVMSRREIEFVVEEFERARQFIEALGYESIVSYEKYRTTYAWDGLHIMLDELPYGEFVEIEGEGVPSIRQMALALGLHWESAIAASYHALFERVAAGRNLDPGRLSFDVFAQGKPSPEELGVLAAD